MSSREEVNTHIYKLLLPKQWIKFTVCQTRNFRVYKFETSESEQNRIVDELATSEFCKSELPNLHRVK
jgi:hypothetical protein